MTDKNKSITFPQPHVRLLLMCGVMTTVWYFLINIIVPLQYEGYSIASQTISELSAIDAPTRALWNFLCAFYTLLLIAFGCGIALSSGANPKMRLAAMLIIINGIFGFFWPPMHQRQVLAAGGGTLTDTLHIAWTIMHAVFTLTIIGLASSALGKGFRIYSAVTVVSFFVFGILTAIESPGINTGNATPYIGIWERINIGASMVWMAVLAIVLLRRQRRLSLGYF